MAASTLPPLISSDGHLEVRPERWTPRMPEHLREKAPRTVKLPDGGDALLVEGQLPGGSMGSDRRRIDGEDRQIDGVRLD